MKPPVCRKNEGMCVVEVESILMRENQNHLYRRFNKISVSCRKEAVRGEVVLRKLEDHETPSSSSATLCKPRTVKVERAQREWIIKGKGWLFYVSKEKTPNSEISKPPRSGLRSSLLVSQRLD